MRNQENEKFPLDITENCQNLPSQNGRTYIIFTPVSYRISTLWGGCPALTELLQLITPSKGIGYRWPCAILWWLVGVEWPVLGVDSTGARCGWMRPCGNGDNTMVEMGKCHGGRDGSIRKPVDIKGVFLVKMKMRLVPLNAFTAWTHI